MNEVERAAEVLYAAPTKGSNETWRDFCVKEAAALSTAGLLRTDADRLNAELAELVVRYVETAYPKPITTTSPSWRPVVEAAHAILDARKPKVAPLDEVLTLWRECKCKVPGPLSDALDRLAAERAK